MRKLVSRAKILQFAMMLRDESMEACMEAHKVSDTSEPRKLAALKERAAIKKETATRIEIIFGGGK